MKLNLGCGTTKIEGYVNIDCNPAVKPDKVVNFISGKLPYRTNSVEEVLLFHTIEHIQKVYHRVVVSEIYRVLKPGGTFICSYPEFRTIAKYWLENFKGKRDWWEKTIFGRQLHPSDFHVCAMEFKSFSNLLKNCGFKDIKVQLEEPEEYNTIISALKGNVPTSYEKLHKREMGRYKLANVK